MMKSQRITDKIRNQKQGLKLIMKELGKVFKYTPSQMRFAEKFIDDGALIHKMAEVAVAKECKLIMCPSGAYQDYTNGWDLKTGVVSDATKKSKKTDRGIAIKGIENKKKGLYIIISDPIVNEVYLFKVPKRVYKGKKEIFFNFRPDGGPRESKKIVSGKKTISWQVWNECRVNNIKDFAK